MFSALPLFVGLAVLAAFTVCRLIAGSEDRADNDTVELSTAA